MAKNITPEQARNLLAISGEHVPYRVLSDAGREALCAFVASRAKHPELQCTEAWCAAAESAINDSNLKIHIPLDMSWQVSLSGQTETFWLQEEHFQWVISDDCVFEEQTCRLPNGWTVEINPDFVAVHRANYTGYAIRHNEENIAALTLRDFALGMVSAQTKTASVSPGSAKLAT